MSVIEEIGLKLPPWRVIALEERRLVPAAEGPTAVLLDRDADRARLREAAWERRQTRWQWMLLALLSLGTLLGLAWLVEQVPVPTDTSSQRGNGWYCLAACVGPTLLPLVGLWVSRRLARSSARARGVPGRPIVERGHAGRACGAGPLGAWLELSTAGQSTLRIGWCEAHAIELDDGGRVEIPAGAWILDGPRARDLEPAEIDALVERIDRRARRDRDLPLFPRDRASLLVVHPGDRVAIASPLERIGVVETSATFRESAGIFRPEGTPRIRWVGPSSQ